MRHKQTPGAIAALPFTAAILLAAVFAWLAREVMTGATMPFDLRVRADVHQWADPVLTAVMIALSVTGAPYVVWPLFGAAFALLWRSGQHGAARLLAVSMAGALAVDLGLKPIFRRPRPAPFFNYSLPESYSFPSGHALFATCLYGVLAGILAGRLQRRSAAVALWSAAALLIAGIGLSRIYLGVHYPSDVIAGYTAALSWILAARAVTRLSYS